MSTRRKRIPHSAFALCARHVRRGCSRMTHRRPRQRSSPCEVQPTLTSPPLAWTATERFPTHRRQSLQQQCPRKPWSANRPLLGKRSRPQPGQKVSLKSFKDLDHTGRSIHVPQCGAHAHVIALIPSTSHSGCRKVRVTQHALVQLVSLSVTGTSRSDSGVELATGAVTASGLGGTSRPPGRRVLLLTGKLVAAPAQSRGAALGTVPLCTPRELPGTRSLSGAGAPALGRRLLRTDSEVNLS